MSSTISPRIFESALSHQFDVNRRRTGQGDMTDANASHFASFFRDRATARRQSPLPRPRATTVQAWGSIPNVPFEFGSDSDSQPDNYSDEWLPMAPPPTPAAQPSVFYGSGCPSPRGSDEQAKAPRRETAMIPYRIEREDVPRPVDQGPRWTFTDRNAVAPRKEVPARPASPSPSVTDSAYSSGGQSAASASTASSPASITDTDEFFTHETQRLMADCMQILSTKGLAACVDDILRRAVQHHASAVPVTIVAKAVLREINRVYPDKGNAFANALRFEAMSMFKEHWRANGSWLEASRNLVENSHLAVLGVNIAGFQGTLFTFGLITAEDIHRCLDLLMAMDRRSSRPHFNRICAMHALLVQADYQLCQSKSAEFMAQFREKITKLSGQWPKTCPEYALVLDTIGVIDRWQAVQENKRARRAYAGVSKTDKDHKGKPSKKARRAV
ncbi:hypothetical protein PLICRDRAFT_173495 [Plicaturopsis crispa FD-325 SS-3]|nr:hypothetical protein PLICRDRAFT_173495 [Plicaturopsis crispa FD-325 SS-3]